MVDFKEKYEIDNNLRNIPMQIENKAKELNEARTLFKYAKALYELRVSEIKLKVKAINPDATQEDIKAEATVGANDLRLRMIEEQSKSEAKKLQYQRLRDDLTALEQRSNNYRNEVKALRG